MARSKTQALQTLQARMQDMETIKSKLAGTRPSWLNGLVSGKRADSWISSVCDLTVYYTVRLDQVCFERDIPKAEQAAFRRKVARLVNEIRKDRKQAWLESHR